MAAGYIYILSNASMPGLVKIGRTDRQPEDRARELSTTGVPTPFKIEYSIFVSDSVEVEKQIHKVLSNHGYRHSPSREFFELASDKAIDLVKFVTADFENPENYAPDFSLSNSLRNLVYAIDTLGYDEVISEQKALSLEKRLSSIGYRGCPYALLRIAEIYGKNYFSALKSREYWQHYLELRHLEIKYWGMQPSSNRLDMRHQLGKEVAQYLDNFANKGWITNSDFDFAQAFLISNDQFVYEGYIDTVKRKEFPESIREKAINL